MITTKENGVQYHKLNQIIIDWHFKTKKTIAWVERPLNYTEAEEPEYIDDITPEEVDEGTRRVRAFLYREQSDPIYMKWQRGEATEQEWLDAVEAIKIAWPKISEA